MPLQNHPRLVTRHTTDHALREVGEKTTKIGRNCRFKEYSLVRARIFGKATIDEKLHRHKTPGIWNLRIQTGILLNIIIIIIEISYMHAAMATEDHYEQN